MSLSNPDSLRMAEAFVRLAGIEVGCIVAAPTGRYRFTGFQYDGRLNLQDLSKPTAFILRYFNQISDLEVEASPTPLEVTRVHKVTGPTPVPATLPSPPTTGVGPTYLALPPVAYVPPPSTLGASRTGVGLCTHPGEETFYWRPCITTVQGWEGVPWLPTEDSHCWFIGSNLNISLLCPGCNPHRNRIVDAPSMPPTMAPRPAPLPWGDGDPIWDKLGGSRGEAFRAWYEERAAIMEFEGGMPRAAAQENAYKLLLSRMQGALFAS